MRVPCYEGDNNNPMYNGVYITGVTLSNVPAGIYQTEYVTNHGSFFTESFSDQWHTAAGTIEVVEYGGSAAPRLTITTTSLSGGRVGESYSQQLEGTAADGSSLTWSPGGPVAGCDYRRNLRYADSPGSGIFHHHSDPGKRGNGFPPALHYHQRGAEIYRQVLPQRRHRRGGIPGHAVRCPTRHGDHPSRRAHSGRLQLLRVEVRRYDLPGGEPIHRHRPRQLHRTVDGESPGDDRPPRPGIGPARWQLLGTGST